MTNEYTKCPVCNGEGHTEYCTFCCGKKRLNWIEQIFGVTQTYEEWLSRFWSKFPYTDGYTDYENKQIIKSLTERDNE